MDKEVQEFQERVAVINQQIARLGAELDSIVLQGVCDILDNMGRSDLALKLQEKRQALITEIERKVKELNDLGLEMQKKMGNSIINKFRPKV